jgi:hypothetical protein
MTQEEAEKVASVLLTADGGYQTCIDNLFEKMTTLFPEIKWNELEKVEPFWSDHLW